MWNKALYVLVALLSGVAAGVAAAAPPMRLTVPKALKAPTIDGKLSAGEWDDAAAVTGVINQFDGLAHPRQAVFWVKYDEKNLYVAQRSTLLPGEKKTPHRYPGFFFDKDNENYIVIGVAPGRPNTGDDPSNYTHQRCELPVGVQPRSDLETRWQWAGAAGDPRRQLLPRQGHHLGKRVRPVPFQH